MRPRDFLSSPEYRERVDRMLEAVESFVALMEEVDDYWPDTISVPELLAEIEAGERIVDLIRVLKALCQTLDLTTATVSP